MTSEDVQIKQRDGQVELTLEAGDKLERRLKTDKVDLRSWPRHLWNRVLASLGIYSSIEVKGQPDYGKAAELIDTKDIKP